MGLRGGYLFDSTAVAVIFDGLSTVDFDDYLFDSKVEVVYLSESTILLCYVGSLSSAWVRWSPIAGRWTAPGGLGGLCPGLCGKWTRKVSFFFPPPVWLFDSYLFDSKAVAGWLCTVCQRSC